MRAFAKFAKDKDDVLLHMQMDWNDIFGCHLVILLLSSEYKHMEKHIEIIRKR
jgi:hypothetical protein